MDSGLKYFPSCDMSDVAALISVLRIDLVSYSVVLKFQLFSAKSV